MEGPVGEPIPVVEVSSSLVLAAERTYRKDPLNGFKRYTGGWNIRERHYWAVSLSDPRAQDEPCFIYFFYFLSFWDMIMAVYSCPVIFHLPAYDYGSTLGPGPNFQCWHVGILHLGPLEFVI